MGRHQDGMARTRVAGGTAMSLPPSRRSAVEPFLVMEVMRAAIDREQAGGRVIHMEVGQPGAPAPRPVIEAARAALADGRFGYTEALGIRALRARFVVIMAGLSGFRRVRSCRQPENTGKCDTQGRAR